MEKRGLQTLFIDSAEVSLNSLESHFSGHVVVAVRDTANQRWLLADPTNRRIISNDWSPDSKTFYGDRFWIGYCGPLAKYPAHSPEELKTFYSRTLQKIPPDFWNQHIFKFDLQGGFVTDGRRRKLPQSEHSQAGEKSGGRSGQIPHPSEKEINVLLVKGGDDFHSTLTYSDERGWVCALGLQSGCAPSLVEYLQGKVANSPQEKISCKPAPPEKK